MIWDQRILALMSANVAVAVAASLASSTTPTPGDIQAAINAAIANGATLVSIPPGTYNFSAEPLQIANASKLLVNATGAELIFTAGGGVRISDASELEILGMVVDTVPFCGTQGVVSNARRDGKWLNYTLSVDEGYGDPVLQGRTLFWNASTRTMLHNQVQTTTVAWSVDHLRDNDWRIGTSLFSNMDLVIPNGSLCSVTPVNDDMFTCINCTAVTYTNVTVYGSSGMAFLEAGGQGGNVYRGLYVGRRPGSTRLLASSIDVLHSTSQAVGLTLLDSELSFAGDDLFAVHCELGVIWAPAPTLPNALYVIDTGGDAARVLTHVRPGESLQFYALNATMDLLASLPVAAVTPVLNETLIAEAQGAWYHIVHTMGISVRNFTADGLLLLVELAAPLPAALGAYSALVQVIAPPPPPPLHFDSDEQKE
jgi:hypothetical protein